MTSIEETLLGIDYGETKIGIAIGKNGLVTPITTISGKNELSAVHEITRYAFENGVNNIILGLPTTADGKETYKASVVKRFGKLLKTVSKKKVIYVNEYRTSKDAYLEAVDYQYNTKKGWEDALAAALILKRYYNEID